MSLRDRLTLGSPLTHSMIPILDALIAAVNTLSAVVLLGDNPHKANDTSDVVSSTDPADLDQVADLEFDIGIKYAAHLASTTYHLAADSVNTLTATTVYAKVKALADDLKAKYNLHHVIVTGSPAIHAGAGDPNTVTAGAVSSKATAITLLNDIRAMFNLHCANVTSCHGAADTTNPISAAALATSATWAEIAARADALRTAYEAHRVLTGGSVHGSADGTNTLSALAVGSVQTSVNTYLTELKGDLNAHIIYLTSHASKDESMKVTVADATTLATSRALAKALKDSFNTHISRTAEASLTVPTLDEL